MINNYKCKNCDHSVVCKVADKLAVFSDEAKRDLGVTITMNDCIEYKEVEDK
jgi:hypothetical protein